MSNQITRRIERFAERKWSLLRSNGAVSLDTVYTNEHDAEGIWITRLYVSRWIRGQGFAREAMERLCEAADEESIILFLDPAPYADGLVSRDQLIDFYETLGFEFQSSGWMARFPNEE